ncbi:pantetheine-phosphate adenylyltransferase [Coxiella endosymbiont of Amblyomma nuttalli]|uniref:pantetheine-phosphate adenylyltransferase n=1 Tax=Coxiella endosymbiont of Amblyomma nuttalli TaxID=2749996 RepID=UPI001BA89F78|nr:pantetheine-phosphate adenylyltransferase [Coxiella endosymbiont of Amblyomma nuttalli]QTS83823.1 Phosphopantetheine adenylyltransferase [Coxiella endosymbiont of Amblyomma nuttalli]
MKIVVYPGTFDPLSNGHIDIIRRALSLFDKVILACAPTSRKNPYLTWNERLDLIEAVCKNFENVQAIPLKGLLVDFARQHHANIILRGLRSVSDFDYECQLAYMNQSLSPKMEVVFLPAKVDYSYISGTLVREILESGGDVSSFVPPLVAHHLQKRKKNNNEYLWR